MSTTHTTNSLSSSFANFLGNLHSSLLAGDFTARLLSVNESNYKNYELKNGSFTLSFSLNDTYESIVHFQHGSTVDLSPFVELFNYDLFSSILYNRKHLSYK